MLSKRLPDESLFPVALMETRPGPPAPVTGVPPSFLTARLAGDEQDRKLSVHLGRPFKLICHQDNLDALRFLYAELDRFQKSEETESNGPLMLPYRQIRLEVVQALLDIPLMPPESLVITAGLSDMKLCLLGHPDASREKTERLDCSLAIGAFTAKESSGAVQLCDPLSLDLRVRLSWPGWKPLPALDPVLYAFCRADNLRLHVGPRQIQAVRALSGWLQDVGVGGSSSDGLDTSPSASPVDDPQRPPPEEQHFQDDLRTGAFSFQVSRTDASAAPERPSPYQVVFNVQPASMCWAYPQPRALTRVDVYPIPLLKADEGGGDSGAEENQVDCVLEYWDECGEEFRPFRRFCLSETKFTRVPLPAILPGGGGGVDNDSPPPPERLLVEERLIFSDLWRIVMNFTEADLPENRPKRIIAAPPSLVACTRIDSYFNADLIPARHVGLSLSHASVTLHSQMGTGLPGVVAFHPPESFQPDGSIPQDFPFASITMTQTQGSLHLPGRFGSASAGCWMDFSTQLQASLINFEYLVEESVLEPTGKDRSCRIVEFLVLIFLFFPVQRWRVDCRFVARK